MMPRYTRRGPTRKLAKLTAVAVAAIAGFSHPSIGGWASPSLDAFEVSLRASLPCCFSSKDLEIIAKEVAPDAIRCRPINIVFDFNDPLPWKLLCMPKEKLAERGPMMMDPPLLLLTVDRQCVTRVTR